MKLTSDEPFQRLESWKGFDISILLQLNSRGFDVVASVSTGEEAVEQTELLLPDLVLMDIMLQGEMNGIQAAEQIIAKLKIPIVYLTACADDVTLERVKKTAPHGFIIKPFEDNELIAVVETALYKHQIEKKLAESEERYRQLVDKAQDIIYETDITGRVTFLNPVGLKITGYSENELIGKHYLDFIDPNFRKKADRFYSLQIIKRKQNTYLEFPFIRKDGTEVYIGQNVQIKEEDGKIIGIQAVARDITERKHALELIDTQYRLGLAVNQIISYEKLLSLCLDAALKISGMESGGIYLVDEDSGEINLVAFKNVSESFLVSSSHYSPDSVNAKKF